MEGDSMKIIIDVPDSIIPNDIKELIKMGCTDIQNRQIVYAFLKLAQEEFYRSTITVAEYRLVLK